MREILTIPIPKCIILFMQSRILKNKFQLVDKTRQVLSMGAMLTKRQVAVGASFSRDAKFYLIEY